MPAGSVCTVVRTTGRITKLLAWAFAACLVLAPAASGQDKDGRVRTKEPTRVTVRGTAEPVKTEPPRERSVVGKVGVGIRNGAASVWNGAVGFAGWLLNTDDDIPSRRDRQRKKSEDSKQ